ncbi:MAG: hypothetical protein IJ083_06615 [Clostridia bacterium]|nr:hypothetical protein [Clostridia bacterium]
MRKQKELPMKCFRLYPKFRDFLSMEERRRLITCIYEYMEHGEVTDDFSDSDCLGMAWLHFKNILDFNRRRDMARRQMTAGIPCHVMKQGPLGDVKQPAAPKGFNTEAAQRRIAMREQKELLMKCFRFYLKIRDCLSKEERRRLITCIYEYIEHGEVTDDFSDSDCLSLVWLHFKDSLDFNRRRDMARRQMTAGMSAMS